MTSELIYKYLSNEASEEEVRTLFEWIDASAENKKYFITLKKTWALSALSQEISIDAAPVIAIRPKNKVFQFFKYAAAFVILCGLAKIALDVSPKTKSKSKEIILEWSDGRSEIITKNNQEKLVLDQNRHLIARKLPNHIIYYGKVPNQKVVYSTITVPYGKRFTVTLSDGTIVSLNSGTTLRYPEQFGLNGKRSVYLSGEAFFEVSKDKKHPFMVNANKVDIEVLGTKFNISAYPENPTVNSTLVEGSIKMSEVENKANVVLLQPNQMATWNNNSKKIITKEVDASFYNAWTKGEIAFKDTPFSTIAKIIQRTYDVEIINKNADLARQNFTGTIKISESSVANILELLKRDTPFQYVIEQNTITITNLPN